MKTDINIWVSKYNLNTDLMDIDNKFKVAINKATTQDELYLLREAHVKARNVASESAKIHALSKKHYSLKIIIEEDVAYFSGEEMKYFPNSIDVTRWKRAVAIIAQINERKMKNWLPMENHWDNHFIHSIKANKYICGAKIILECNFHRIEYLDPDELFKYIFKIYSDVLDCVKKINQTHHQHFKIVVKDRQDNEWFAVEAWPKEEGHWKTIWKT